MKNKDKTKLKNIMLCSAKDPMYQIYLSQFKHERQPDIVYDKIIPKKSETMGYLLQLSVNDWVQKSGIYLDENIISYEYGQGNRFKKKFKEVDYVLKKGNNLIVGEVKVSSCENGSTSKACKQLTFSKELLNSLRYNVTMQIIRIDLNYKNANQPFDSFNTDFTKVIFRDFVWNGIKFKFLYLNAQDVFNYGVLNKVINSPEIFQPVIYETDLLHERRLFKKEFKEKNKLLDELIDSDEEKIIKSEIKILEQNIFLNEIKINLSDKGWSLTSNVSSELLKTITASLGNSNEQSIEVNGICERTNGYCNYNPTTKYVSLYCNSEEIEVNILDAERVYLRIPIEERLQLQNIHFVVADNLCGKVKSYPLFNKLPTRIFFYSDKLLQPTDSENKSLRHFEQVINNSQATKVQLKKGDLLLIDNHRMLQQRTAKTDKLNCRLILD